MTRSSSNLVCLDIGQSGCSVLVFAGAHLFGYATPTPGLLFAKSGVAFLRFAHLDVSITVILARGFALSMPANVAITWVRIKQLSSSMT